MSSGWKFHTLQQRFAIGVHRDGTEELRNF